MMRKIIKQNIYVHVWMTAKAHVLMEHQTSPL